MNIKLLKFEKIRTGVIQIILLLIFMTVFFSFFTFPVVYYLNKLIPIKTIDANLNTINFKDALYEPVDLNHFDEFYFTYPMYHEGIIYNYKIYFNEIHVTDLATMSANSIYFGAMEVSKKESISNYWHVVKIKNSQFLLKSILPEIQGNEVIGMIRPLPDEIKFKFIDYNINNYTYIDSSIITGDGFIVYSIFSLFCLVVVIFIIIQFIKNIFNKGLYSIYRSNILKIEKERLVITSMEESILFLLRNTVKRKYKSNNYVIERKIFGLRIVK